MLEAPNAGALPAPNAGVLDDPNAGTLEPPNAGVLEAANAGVLEAPITGVLAAPNGGVLDAPKVSGPDWVAPNAGVLAAAPKAGIELPKAGVLAGGPKPLFALAPNMPMGALDGWEAEAAAAPKAGVLAAPNAGTLPLRKPRPQPTAADGKPEDEALAAAAEAPKVKDEAAAAEGGAMNEGTGKPLVVGASGVGPVSSATKGLAAPAPADGETDMLLSRLRPLPPLCKVHSLNTLECSANTAWALSCGKVELQDSPA